MGCSQFAISSTLVTSRSTEQVDVAVTVYICIWEVLGSHLGRHTGYFDIFAVFLSSSRQM
jgi:hypothetical protein